MLQGKYASIDNLILVKLLGRGGFAKQKVKKGLDPNQNQQYAVKILRLDEREFKIDAFKKEGELLTKIDHKNVVKIVRLLPEAEYRKKNGTSYKCFAIVMELATNGELFDYISLTGTFSEPVARSFFRILFTGICHRDLKPENLLFDQDFNVKIADFGCATLTCGRNHNGQLTTATGTPYYMAPEVHLGKPYTGEEVDKFSLGVILYVMVKGNMPFSNKQPFSADKMKCINEPEKFWAARDPDQKFSKDFRSFIEGMLAFEAKDRLSNEQIIQHPWYEGEIIDYEELRSYLIRRKIKVQERRGFGDDAELKAKRERLEEEMKRNRSPSKSSKGFKPFRHINGEIKESNLKEIYFRADNSAYEENREFKLSNLYTIADPIILYEYIYESICPLLFNEIKEDSSQLKLQGNFIEESDDGIMEISVLRMEDGGSCVEFKRLAGPTYLFSRKVHEITQIILSLSPQQFCSNFVSNNLLAASF